MRLVDQSTFSDEQKRIYTNLIRAQLSASQQVVLFFNCLSKWGRDKFKPLLERYALLKTLPSAPILSADYRLEYPDSAYGRERDLQDKKRKVGER